MNFIRDLFRLRKIGFTFFEFGLGYVATHLGLRWCTPLWCRMKCFVLRRHCPRPDMPQAVRLSFEHLGPTFMKLGQVLSMRPDFVPVEYVKELQKLQEHAPEVPFSKIKETVESELKRPLNDIFESFDERPVAAASLGQVHKARLRGSGETVAVKVQRPNIIPMIKSDLRIMHHLARTLEKRVKEVRNYRPTRAIEAFERSMDRELDYTIEGRNADLMRYNFRNEEGVKIPNIFWKETTKRVLTMEFISGTQMGDMDRLSREGFDHKKLMDNCTRACLLPPILHGFFHADPHPGNVWALPGNRVCYLDFGMMGSIDRGLRQRLMLFFLAFTEEDVEMVLHYLSSLVEVTPNSDLEEFKVEAASSVIAFLNDSKGRTLTQTFYEMISCGSKYGVYFPSQLILLAKAMVTGESMCRMSHPDLDYLKISKPLLEEIYDKEFGIRRLLKSYRVYIPKLITLFDRMTR
ncbi:MAG: hypothetical protein CL678_06690 [Bdellovibrionaceae bacterium]|nr:hypothetical protein [Pseudobdellovibrionaceae bacterium]